MRSQHDLKKSDWRRPGAGLVLEIYWKYKGGGKGKVKEITNQETMGMTGAGLSRE